MLHGYSGIFNCKLKAVLGGLCQTLTWIQLSNHVWWCALKTLTETTIGTTIDLIRLEFCEIWSTDWLVYGGFFLQTIYFAFWIVKSWKIKFRKKHSSLFEILRHVPKKLVNWPPIDRIGLILLESSVLMANRVYTQVNLSYSAYWSDLSIGVHLFWPRCMNISR